MYTRICRPLVLVGALVSMACGHADDTEGAGEKAQPQTAEESALLTIALPAGKDVDQVGLAANGTLLLRDRASYADASGTFLELINVGSTTTELGSSSHSGPVTSHASVTLRSNATVHGNLRTRRTVSAQNGARVLGTTTEHAALPAPAILSWDAPVAPLPSQPRTVTPDGQLDLPPGAYGAVTVFSRGKLKLRSGNYAFSSLQLEPDAILDVTVTPANGPVALYVDEVRAFRGRVVTSTQSTSESLLLVHKGTTSLRLERSADMAIVAPLARVELATGGARSLAAAW